MTNGALICSWKSVNSSYNHSDSLDGPESAINSASVENKATQVYLRHDQDTSAPYSLNKYPLFDFLLGLFSSQLASEYPKSISSLSETIRSFKSSVPFKYLTTLFNYNQSSSFDLLFFWYLLLLLSILRSLPDFP